MYTRHNKPVTVKNPEKTAKEIVDHFENYLKTYGIIIPDARRPAGNNTPIYSHYSHLIYEIEELICK